MKLKIILIVIHFIPFGSIFSQEGIINHSDFPLLEGPYLGQNPPGLKSELFAPGILQTGDNEHLYGFFNYGTFFLFDRTSPDLEEWTPSVYMMELKNGQWTKPNDAPFLGKPWYNYYTVAPEGTLVYFSWKGSLTEKSSSNDVNLWLVKKTSEGWTDPKKFEPPINSDYLDTYPSVTRDNTLYFFSNREGGFGGHDVYRSRLADGKNLEVENLGETINTENDELDPFIAPDESYLIYSSNKLDGFGDLDLYITFRKPDKSWTKPVNMGENINSKAFDWVPYVTPDGKYFFFNSNRKGSWDIYWVDANIIEELKPQDLKH
jgi:Tol biopolymer transport system component